MRRIASVVISVLALSFIIACESQTVSDPGATDDLPSLAEIVVDEIQPIEGEQWEAIDQSQDDGDYLVDRLMRAAEGKGMSEFESQVDGATRIRLYSFEDGSELWFTLEEVPEAEGVEVLVRADALEP